MSQAGYVYIVHAIGTLHIKVGKTTNLPRRIQGIAQGMPFPVRLLYAELVHDMDLMEQALKSRYTGFHTRGEWFELSPDMLAIWPSPEVSPPVPDLGQGQPRLRVVQARPTLEERMLALLKRYQSLSVRQMQQHISGARSQAIQDILLTLEQQGVVTHMVKGKRVVFALAEVA